VAAKDIGVFTAIPQASFNVIFQRKNISRERKKANGERATDIYAEITPNTE